MKTRIASILLIICLSVAYAAEAPPLTVLGATGNTTNGASLNINGPTSLIISGPQASITIKTDGTVDLGKNTLPEAALAFWKGVTAAAPDFAKWMADENAKKLEAENVKLTAQVAELQKAYNDQTKQFVLLQQNYWATVSDLIKAREAKP